MTPPRERIPPQCALKYELLKELGTGGFGSVYLANQISLGRQVALKVLHAIHLKDPSHRRRFESEARITSELRHPAIVQVLDHAVEDGIPWIAYEYIPGDSLRAQLSRGPLPPDRIAAAGMAVAQALEVAHAAGVLHRDIKPDNILEHSGGFKLTDFGIAKAIGSRGVTETGMLIGSPGYMAPELFAGSDYSHATDLYALGVMLYELTCGRLPFESDDVARLVEQMLAEDAPSLRDLRPDVPITLVHLVRELLARHPAERPGTADVLDRLEALAMGPSRSPAPLVRDGSPTMSGASMIVAPRPALTEYPARKRWLAAGLLVIVLAIAGFSSFARQRVAAAQSRMRSEFTLLLQRRAIDWLFPLLMAGQLDGARSRMPSSRVPSPSSWIRRGASNISPSSGAWSRRYRERPGSRWTW